MKKIGAIFYFFAGLASSGCWGFNMVRAIERVNVFMIGAFGFLTLLSVLMMVWAAKEYKEE